MMELWITLPEDFDRRVAEFRKNLEGQGVVRPRGRLLWDPLKSELIIGDRTVSIPHATNQSLVCDELFALPQQGQWLEDIVLRGRYYSESETSLSSAIRALNEAASKGFGIEDLFEFKRDRARIRIENLTQEF